MGVPNMLDKKQVNGKETHGMHTKLKDIHQYQDLSHWLETNPIWIQWLVFFRKLIHNQVESQPQV